MRVSWQRTSLAAVLLWLACETVTTPGGDDCPRRPEPPSTAGLFAYRYVFTGDTILTLRVDTAYCLGTVLIRDTVTMAVGGVVSAESLILMFPDNFGAGAVVATIVRCTRLDTGTGLEGRWRVVADEHAVISGALSGPEARAWAVDTLIADRMIAQQGYVLQFTSSWVVGTFQGSLGSVVLPWVSADVPDSCRVTVTVSGDTIQVVGLLSGEVVTVAVDERLNRRYASSRASRIPYTVWRRPEDCAHRQTWFADFVSDNMPFADEFIRSDIVTPVVQLGAVDVVRVDDRTVRLTGRVTAEVVTVSCDSTGVVTFSSTRSGHDDWTTVRRSGLTPGWWDQFVTDNIS